MWIAPIALSLLALVVVGRACTAVRENKRFNPIVAPGHPDDRGFRLLYVDPDSGRPARYNPCEELHYVVNPDNAPTDGLSDIQQAAASAAEATGMDIVFEGLTDEVPSLERRIYLPGLYGERWPPILVGWIPRDAAVFREHGVGVAGSNVVESPDGNLVFVTGAIILNSDMELSGGFEAGRTWGSVILHEWGHVLGLDHVDDTTQVMHGSLLSTPARWGSGDQAGLRELGRTAGCLDTPGLP